MKFKITKIQEIFMKGIAFIISTMIIIAPVANATTSLNDGSSLFENIISRIMYGTVGSTAEAIKKYFESGYSTLTITNEEQLRALAEYVNNGNSCEGKVIKLGNNIVVNSNEEWIPIGKEGAAFKGTFNGNNYIISGINFNRNNKLNSEITNVGLFGYVQKATIKNVKLENSKLSIPYTLTPDILGTSIDVRIQPDNDNGLLNVSEPAYRNLGAVVGYNNEGNITNCTINNVDVSGLTIVGGIVGYNYKGIVANCKSENSKVKGLYNVGGIVGENKDIGTVKKCTNKASVSAFINSGGIVGASYGTNITGTNVALIKDCINEGNVSGFVESIGGIAGRNTRMSTIESCINKGTVEISTNDIELQALKSYIIRTSDQALGTLDQHNVGGIVGWSSGDKINDTDLVATINSCVNEGKVNGVHDTGGLVGQLGGAGGGITKLVYSTNKAEVTPDPSDENGETGYVTGEIGVDEAIAYLYDNKYYVGSTQKTAGKVDGATNNKYSNNTNSKEYGMLRKNCTVYFIENNEDSNYNNIPEKVTFNESNIGYKSNTVTEDTVIGNTIDTSDSDIKVKVDYTLYRNGTKITEDTYLKQGQTLKVVAKFDKYLAKTYGPVAGIDDDVMQLKINNEKDMTVTGVSASNSSYTTTITYTYTVNAGEEFNVDTLNLSKNGTVYVLSGNDFAENHPTMSLSNNSTAISGIRVDAVAPKIETKIYVENELKTARYTAGKEVLIKMTTSEKVQDITDIPVVKVNFSKSGEGKYNYQGTDAGAGYAKPIDGRVNDDETATILYSYQIQEGDEGDIAVAYTSGIIKDLAGNETDLTQYTQFTASETVNPVNLNRIINARNVATNVSENKNISYKLYKGMGNSKQEITSTTYINSTDTITVEAIIDGFVYSNYTNGTSGNNTTFLNTTTAPELKINNILATPVNVERSVNPSSSVKQGTYDDAKTTITYTLSGNSFNYSYITKLSSMVFKPSTTLYISNRYATMFATSGAGSEELYDIAQMNSVTAQIPTTTTSTVNISGLNIYADPIGIAETFSGSIYADTTKPTVEIIADNKYDFNEDGKFNTIDVELVQRYLSEFSLDVNEEKAARIENRILKSVNANNRADIDILYATILRRMLTGEIEYSEELVYNFIWSEEVIGFTSDDVTVNGGTKGELSQAIRNEDGTYTYTMKVTPSVSKGNKGELQVIVEQDAVYDLAYQGNIRNEKVIQIDKKAPKLENYELKQENGKIIVEATFDEEILSAKATSGLSIKVNGIDADGEYESPVVLSDINGNRVRYVYNISGADGGEVEIKLVGQVEDMSGNYSDKMDITIPNDIVLQKNIIKDGDIEYSFKKGNTPISDFSKPTYFKAGNVIKVTKKEDGVSTTFTYTVVSTDDNGHIISMKLNDPEEGNVKYSKDRVTDDIDISVANIYFDTVSPIVTTEVQAVNPKDGLYITGEELIITTTSSEKVTENERPVIKVTFDGKDGRFNNGEAKYVEIKDNEDGTTSWIYRYVISEGDEGRIGLAYKAGKVTDLAENSISITSLNNEEGIFELNNITVDATLPTVAITAKKKENNTKTAISGNVTNADVIEYTFTWSEDIVGFDPSDITVNNGSKGTLSAPTRNSDGTVTYTMDITPSIENGNTGDIQVIIEKDAAKDSVGLGNIRTESVIRVDKQAPILISLEAFAESNIGVSTNVDSVKQYYKAGEQVTIVATFNENIIASELPELALEFSESGNAKNTVSDGVIEGNKITYTYIIKNEDNGRLSVKGFTGKVIDNAGNETVVTKRTLDGDTVIADTINPTLVSLVAIAPEFEYDEFIWSNSYTDGNLTQNGGDTIRYGVQSKTRDTNTITVIATYSENIYNLSSNSINNIINSNAPTLKLKFGNSTERTATFQKVEGDKIYYTYNIRSGDNGDLQITSLSGTVSDLAGNTLTTSTSLPTVSKYEVEIKDENKVNEIVADTTKPSYTIKASAVDKDDNNNDISGNGSYYRKGSIITIIVNADETIYNNNNKVLTRFTKENAPILNIKFGNEIAKVARCIDADYGDIDQGPTFTYEYVIADGDNGTLTVSIAENTGYDIALNGNNAKTQTISNIIADTVYPVTNWQSWVESEAYGIEDNEDGSWTVTFSETMYVYNPDTNTVVSVLSNSNKSYAPILLVSNDNVTPLETTISSITASDGKTVITYTYSPYARNIGAYGMKFANVSDKAGNLFNYRDQVAPTLSNIKVTEPESGTYKAGIEITIVATFSEKVMGTAPKLAIVFGDGATRIINSGEIIDNTITYKYTITDGDNGRLEILSIEGEGLSDLYDNRWVAPENVSISGNEIIADTIAPTLIITANEEKTNKDVVTYTITWSEDVKGFTAEDIEIVNGSKGTFTKVNNKVYTLEVDTTNEGRQIVKVPAGACEDIAGNENVDRATYNKVVIDYTKPEIRARVNGGKYVIDKDTSKSTIKEIIVVNEEISKFEYTWSDSETLPEDGWTEYPDVNTLRVNSDIPLTTSVDNEGTYYLYMIITDKAGNVFRGRTNGYVVSNDKITLTPNTTELTNQDVTVTVYYGTATTGLTQNRKAGIQGISQSADPTKVIITENGVVYAEATDKNGNKVYATLEISNIDKTAPTAEITYVTNEDGSVTATITLSDGQVTNNDGNSTHTFTENGEFTFEFEDAVGNKGTAVARVTSIVKEDEPEPTPTPTPEDTTAPEVTFNYTTTSALVNTPIGATITTNEDAKIYYSWGNTWASTNDFVRSINVTKTFNTEGTYVLYVKAIDKAGNESAVSRLNFIIVENEDDIQEPEIEFEDLTVIQKNGVKYVKVSPTYTVDLLRSKINTEKLLGVTPTFTKLTSENKLKTGSEIQLNGVTKYTVIVNGDVNCDGKVDFINDIVMINNYRTGKINNLPEIQILAGDINNSGTIEFISDIVSMNNYRLGNINVL